MVVAALELWTVLRWGFPSNAYLVVHCSPICMYMEISNWVRLEWIGSIVLLLSIAMMYVCMCTVHDVLRGSTRWTENFCGRMHLESLSVGHSTSTQIWNNRGDSTPCVQYIVYRWVSVRVDLVSVLYLPTCRYLWLWVQGTYCGSEMMCARSPLMSIPLINGGFHMHGRNHWDA